MAVDKHSLGDAWGDKWGEADTSFRKEVLDFFYIGIREVLKGSVNIKTGDGYRALPAFEFFLGRFEGEYLGLSVEACN